MNTELRHSRERTSFLRKNVIPAKERHSRESGKPATLHKKWVPAFAGTTTEGAGVTTEGAGTTTESVGTTAEGAGVTAEDAGMTMTMNERQKRQPS